jgi:hypothetical protein
MFGPLFGAGAGLIDAAGYVARCEAGVAALAQATGFSPESEVERFRALRARLERRDRAVADPFAWMRREIGAVLAAAYEMVLVYREGTARGFALLTQGAYGAPVPQRTALLFETAVASYVEGGGDVRAAEWLADAFRTSFPDLAALGAYDATAQAMVVGFVPKRRGGIELKVYFNTRLSPGANRDRVRALLATGGIVPADFERLYDALYDEAHGARFAGVGLDVEAGPIRRMKLYVRTPTDRLAEHAAALGDPMKLPELPRALLADEAELGLALRSDGGRSQKLTLFFDSAAPADPVLSAAVALLGRSGADPQPLRLAFDALRLDNPATGLRQPLHGIGVESGAPAKLNLYLQPPA